VKDGLRASTGTRGGGCGPNRFGPGVPAIARRTIRMIPPTNGTRLTTIHQPDLFGVQAGISASLVAGQSAESYESGERPPGHLSTVGT